MRFSCRFQTALPVVLFFSLLAVTTLSVAQPPTENPAHESIVERLDGMVSVPLNEWHFHKDDFPHPELAGAAVANWPTIKAGEDIPAGIGWLCRWVEIPETVGGYGIGGSNIRLDLDFSGDNLLSRIYFDGSLVANVTWANSPFAITGEAKPGQRIFVAVYVGTAGKEIHVDHARLLFDDPAGAVGPAILRDELAVADSLVATATEGKTALAARVDAAAAS